MTEELNLLKNRDKASIDKIESCFREGPLASAMAVAPQIERRQLSQDEFVHKYRREGRPVILEGLLEHWPARHKWSFEYLAARCANARVVVDSYHSKRARDVRFAEFVDMLKSS